MGQGQSQHAEVRPATPEAEVSLEERARIQAEERERRAAAAQSRLAGQNKKVAGTKAAQSAVPRKKTSLEQLSAENRGWRVADENAELRAWN